MRTNFPAARPSASADAAAVTKPSKSSVTKSKSRTVSKTKPRSKSAARPTSAAAQRSCRWSRTFSKRCMAAVAALLMPVAGGAQAVIGGAGVQVGSSASATITVTATAASGGTVSQVQVLTEGIPSVDFTLGSAAGCAALPTLAVNQTCTQVVNFNPSAPGVRKGAVVLLDSSNNVIGTAFVSGTGSAGLGVLVPGNIIPVAGSGAWDLLEDGQLATNADLNLPADEVLDAAGNLYIADSVHNRIRKVTAATQIISTIAGDGSAGYAGDGGLASANTVSLNTPSGVAIDGAGNIFIADTGNNVVREIIAGSGIITTVAGNSTPGSGGDNGAAASANLNGPWGVTVDAAGNLYIADTGNNRIRKVTAVNGLLSGSSIITTIAGGGTVGANGPSCGTVGDTCTATLAELNRPYAVAFDSSFSNMYIADSGNNRIRLVNSSGIISTFAGTGIVGFSGDGGPAAAAEMWVPSGVAVDVAGNVYISDTQNNAIRKVSAATGTISTIIRSTVGKYFYENNQYETDIYGPMGLTLDSLGNLYVADYYFMRIREVQANVADLDFTGSPTRQGSISASQNQTVENDGNAALTLNTISPDSNSQVGTGGSCQPGTSLAVNGVCTVAAEFAPTVAGDPLIANINVAGPTVNTPLDIVLVGNATAVNSTSIALSSSLNPSHFGQSVKFTAAVTTGANTGALIGTVDFFDGTTKIQSAAALNGSGIATFTTPSLSVGAHSITAVYSGDTGHLASTSSPINQVVDEVTATNLTSSSNPSAVGASVTFTAAVSVSGGGGVAPDGSVVFSDGGSVLATVAVNGSGIAQFSTSTLAQGPNAMTATYSGDPVYDILGSTSATLTQDVQAPSIAVVTSVPNPSSYGTAVTFSATVTSNGNVTPSGTVNIFDGSTQIGSTTLTGTTGVGTFSISTLTAGSHAITAGYQGSPSNAPATSAPIIQVVNLTPTTTVMGANPSPGIAGKPVTLTATVNIASGSAPVTGTVTFSDGTTTLGTGRLANNTASVSVTLSAGAHALVATYGGDSNDNGSASAPLPLEVNLATTAVALTSSATPAMVLSSVTFTATVTGNGGIPGGVVSFLVDGTSAGTGTLNAGGVATFADSGLTVGTHTIVASYGGDINDASSVSAALSEVVQPIPTTTSLGVGATSGPNSQPILVATTVGPSGPIPTGSVTFVSGSTVIGSTTLDSSGVGTLLPDLPAGSYSIIANYGGDSIHSASSSTAVTVASTPIGFNVSVAPPTMTLATTQNGTVSITLTSNNGFADTVGLGCLSLPAMVNCHFSQNSVSLTAGGSQTVQLTIDTNNPLGGGSSASNARPGSGGLSLAGLFMPISLLFGWVAWRFRKRHAAALVAALALFLAGAIAVTGCGATFSQNSANPGNYTIQVGGVGTGSNISHYENVTLTITK